jgi:hypothetical protein
MADKHPKRPRDLNQWAKRMVDLATETDAQSPAKPKPKPKPRKKPVLVKK